MRVRWAMLVASVVLCACSASATAARFGRPIVLTPNGGAFGDPQVAVGSDNRTVAVWVQRGALIARLGRAERLGPPQTLDRHATEISQLGGDLVAAVGRGGTVAVAWMSPRPPRDIGVLVAIAPPGRRFGRPRWISGSDTAFGLDEVGIDGGGHVLVTWRGFDPQCCGIAPIRYAAGSAGHTFTRPRTLPVGHKVSGLGQVIETAAGRVIATAESDPSALFALEQSGRGLAPLPAPPLDVGTDGLTDVAAGPAGIGAAVYSTSVALGPYFGADVGATLLPSAGIWSTPKFVPLPASTPEDGPGSDPMLALPAGGSTVLGFTIGTQIELAVAPPGGAFGAPLAVGRTQQSVPPEPQLEALGADAVLAWLAPHGRGRTLDVAVQPPTGPPRTQELGPVDQLTAESLAAGGSTAVIAWVSHHRVLVAFASAR